MQGVATSDDISKLYKQIQIQNRQQQEMIDLLNQHLKQKDSEITELRRIVENPTNRVNSSPIRRGPQKDYIIENKLRVLKKSMKKNQNQKVNSDVAGILPEIREN